jgi:hypothetical protein
MKHAVRRQFHPQLRRLWKANSAIRESLATQVEPFRDVSPLRFLKRPKSTDELVEIGINRIADKWERFGYRFVPLVTEELSVRCSIDVLFLRPEGPGLLMKGGDLDARLKTLFDALRLPSDLSETGGIGPQEDENPFFCLLEDDKLISEVHVTTDELLVLPKDRDVKASREPIAARVHFSSSIVRTPFPMVYGIYRFRLDVNNKKSVIGVSLRVVVMPD